MDGGWHRLQKSHSKEQHRLNRNLTKLKSSTTSVQCKPAKKSASPGSSKPEGVIYGKPIKSNSSSCTADFLEEERNVGTEGKIFDIELRRGSQGSCWKY